MEAMKIESRLAGFGVSSADLRWLIGGISAEKDEGAGEWAMLVSCVDESDYGWEEWIKALRLLDKRIVAVRGGERPELRKLIGYVGCVAEGLKNVPGIHALEDEVAAAFDSFGFADEAAE